MNDAREPEYATGLLLEAAEAIRSLLPADRVARFDELMGFAERRGLEAFLLCAARRPDLLTVWRGYGASTVPYAIELDATTELLPVEQREGEIHPFPPEGWRVEDDIDDEGRPFVIRDPDEIHVEAGGWVKVNYGGRGVARTRVERMATRAEMDPEPLSDVLLPWLNLATSDLLRLKDPAFIDEREARMIFEVTPRWKFVKHRATRFAMTPYIEISAVDDQNRDSANQRFVTQRARKLPIVSVHIGPSPVGEESVDAVREFLEFHGYPGVSVYRSRTPFR